MPGNEDTAAQFHGYQESPMIQMHQPVQSLHDIDQERACEAIEGERFDFTATFLAAYDLNRIVQRDAGAIRSDTIATLKRLLLSNAFDGQQQRRFLFREAAAVLASLIQVDRNLAIAGQAYDALMAIFRHGREHALQAAADAMGSLPLGIRGPGQHSVGHLPVRHVGWERLLDECGLTGRRDIRIKGRSLLIPSGRGRITVFKLGRTEDDLSALRREIQWISYLSDLPMPNGCQFDVPEAISADGTFLFKVRRLPKELTPPSCTDEAPLAIGYITSEHYFRYPNSRLPGELPSAEAFLEMMGRNAFLFARLSSLGIMHEAPIPLFHNRLQQERRRDGGMYEWFRAGRLDRWLDSCDYPNFGASGLRDFEHFSAFDGKPIDLYRGMGHQLLSLLLVAGSYSRAKDPGRAGWDPFGRPVDATDLFDRRLLCVAINTIYGQYHAGFTGELPGGSPPVQIGRLADRMIDEMGVDRYMQETLRVVDQKNMTRQDFECFLNERGCSADEITGIEQGTQDLDLMTGPHLGAFNRGISIPELIDAAAAMAAACVAERYMRADPAGQTTPGR